MADSRKFCPDCGTVGVPMTKTRGSLALEIVLWLMFCGPGLIYSIWRLTTRYAACPACESPAVIPLNSPRALAAIRQAARAEDGYY